MPPLAPLAPPPAMAAETRPAPRRAQAGFSLIELLVVVAVLSAVAWVALGAVEGDTNAIRDSATRARLQEIRRAIVGRADLALNGGPMVSGYVADVGRLPQCLEALQSQSADCDGDGDADAPAWSNVGNMFSHGWRGPYLVANGDDGAFFDAFGNEGGAADDYGWEVDATAATFDVVSRGRGRGLDADDGLNDDIAMTQIVEADHLVDIAPVVIRSADIDNSAGAVDIIRCIGVMSPDPADPHSVAVAIVTAAPLVVSAGDVGAFSVAVPGGLTLPIGRRTAFLFHAVNDGAVTGDDDLDEVNDSNCTVTPSPGRSETEVFADVAAEWTPFLVTPRVTLSSITIALD